jgi:hypothetical protein
MTKAKQVVTPPPAAMPDGETNSYLAQFKVARVREWSHTRMNALYEQADLARYLWALDREPEALEILRSCTSVITAPPLSRNGERNFNVWCPVADLHALEARISRLAGDLAAAAEPTERIVAAHGIADNPAYIANRVAEAPVKIRDAFAERSVKWACHKLSRTVGGLIILRELALAGHPFSRHFSADTAEELIVTGRERLADRLSAAA